MFRLFLAQLGFLPISVLLVTIIINQLLSQRAKAAKLRKLNMVIGAFFSEVGTDLLSMFSRYVPKPAAFRDEIKAIGSWSDRDFTAGQQRLRHFDFEIVMAAGDPETLCYFLLGKRDFLLRLLENPNLLEHDYLRQPAAGGLPSDRRTGAAAGSGPFDPRGPGAPGRGYRAGLRRLDCRVAGLYAASPEELSLPLLPGPAHQSLRPRGVGGDRVRRARRPPHRDCCAPRDQERRTHRSAPTVSHHLGPEDALPYVSRRRRGPRGRSRLLRPGRPGRGGPGRRVP